MNVFEIPPPATLAADLVRLVLAGLFGGLIGWQRERVHAAAGLRTHVLVSVGAALFVLASLESGLSTSDLSRVVQGIVAGIGFLGAGVILKREEQSEVHGLTTAASVWLTAGVGVATGAGRVWLPLAAAAAAWITLGPLARLEAKQKSRGDGATPGPPSP